MIENGEDHPILNNLEIFQVAFAWKALLPPLLKYGSKVPIKTIREPFQALESWNKVRSSFQSSRSKSRVQG